MIARKLAETLRKSPKSVLLLGPRQVGKSTLIESLAPDMVINLASPSEYLAFTSNPSELEERIAQQNPHTVFIDEIQKIPELLDAIQVLIDANRKKLKFYLSGSSARKLRRGSANLLPGRLLTYRLGPLSSFELNGKMETRKALERGCLPEPYLSERSLAEKILRSYTSTYLQEEILQETVIRQIAGFSRFLQVVAQNAGLFLDLSKMSTKAKVNRSAARRYFEILEDTLICEKVEGYPSEVLDLIRHPKYYLFDVGVMNASLGNFHASEDRKGLLFEHLFYNQLRNTAFALDREIKVWHFRTRGGFEIDFLIELDRKFFAVELKSGSIDTKDAEKLEGLDRLLGRPVRSFVAGIDVKARKVGKVAVRSWQDVLEEVFR